MKHWNWHGSGESGQSAGCRSITCDQLREDSAVRKYRLARCALGLLCFFTMLAVPAWGDDLIDGIRSCLGNPEVVRGEFEQKKVIEALGRPLISRGDFVFVRDHGVVWRTHTPFAQTLRLTRTSITQEQGGQVLFKLSADREPAIRAMSEILLPLFGAKFSQLEKHFQISGEVKGKSWRVVLDPSPAVPLQVFRQIRLEGTSHIQRVELMDANGDRTEIRFSHVQTGDALTPEEERLLQ
jgi:hypothetical protein